MRITVLGCGASTGVPLITGDWGACNPKNPKNQRKRASVLVEAEGKTILIDTGPDLREQLLRLSGDSLTIDAVYYTHSHYDHIAGIVDLRHVSLAQGKPIPIFGSSFLLRYLTQIYDFMFKTFAPVGYPFLEAHAVTEGDSFPVAPGSKLLVRPFEQIHGSMPCFGYRIGDFAYSTDMKDLPPASKKHLQGLSVWMINCLGDHPSPAHTSVAEALGFVRELRPKRAFLTHMSAALDYDALLDRLPEGVEPAYDGLVIEIG